MNSCKISFQLIAYLLKQSSEEEIAYIALHRHQLIRICFEGFPTLLNVPRRFPGNERYKVVIWLQFVCFKYF